MPPLDDDTAPPPQEAPQQPDIFGRIATARNAGYSDADIFSHLSQSQTYGPKIAAARQAGYTDDDIYKHWGLTLGEGGPSTAGVTARAAERNLIPTAAGAAGFYPGMVAGAAVGALAGPAAPVTSLIGGVAGGLISGAGAGYLASLAQEYGLKQVPQSWVEALGQSEAQRKADIAAHPTAEFFGSVLPQAAFLRPGLVGKVPALIGAGLTGGQEAVREYQEGDFSPEKLAIATGAGAFLQRPTRAGRALGLPDVSAVPSEAPPETPPPAGTAAPPGVPQAPPGTPPQEMPTEGEPPPRPAPEEDIPPETFVERYLNGTLERQPKPEPPPAAAPADQIVEAATGEAPPQTPTETSAAAEQAVTEAEAETSRAETASAAAEAEEPTPAQAEAGNYKKGKVSVHGMDVSIETPSGAVRRGVGPDGQPWENTSAADYGYIRRSEGADGEQVDAYVGPNPASKRVFVFDQKDPVTGSFDEHKVVLGTNSLPEARAIYDAGFSDGSGPSRRMGVTEMSVGDFKRWLKDGNTSMPMSAAAAATTATRLRGQPRAPREPQNILDFLASIGGVQDPTGELRAMDLHKRNLGWNARMGAWIRSPKGKSPDYAREAAEEAGWLPEGSTISDMYEAIDNTIKAPRDSARAQDRNDRAAMEHQAYQKTQEMGISLPADATLEDMMGAIHDREERLALQAEAGPSADRIEQYVEQSGEYGLPEMIDEEPFANERYVNRGKEVKAQPESGGYAGAARVGRETAAGEAAARAGTPAQPEGGGAAPGEGAGVGAETGRLGTAPDTPGRPNDKLADFKQFHQANGHTDDPTGLNAAARAYTLARGKTSGFEWLAAYDPRWEDVTHAGTDFARNTVSFGADLTRLARDPNAQYVLHHNHPMGEPVSGLDIGALAGYPGVHWVIAHLPDGGVSAARLNPAVRQAILDMADKVAPTDRDHALDVASTSFTGAAAEIERAADAALKPFVAANRISSLDAALSRREIANRALADAGIIDYITSRELDRLPTDIRSEVQLAAEQKVAILKANSRLFKDLPNADQPTRTVPPDAGLRAVLGGNEAVPAGEPAGDRGDQTGAGRVGQPEERAPRQEVVGQARAERAEPTEPSAVSAEPPLLNTTEATPEELARRQALVNKARAEATMAGRKVAKKPQENELDLPLFGGKRQGTLLERNDEEEYPLIGDLGPEQPIGGGPTPAAGRRAPEQPAAPRTGAEHLDNVAREMADAVGGGTPGAPSGPSGPGGPSTEARALDNMARSSTQAVKNLNAVERFAIRPRVLATLDDLSSRFWNAWQRRTAEANTNVERMRATLPTFLKLDAQGRGRVEAALELARVWNWRPVDNGQPVRVRNTSVWTARKSAVGDDYVLTRQETQAFHETLRWGDLGRQLHMEALAKREGWSGPLDLTAIASRASELAGTPDGRRLARLSAILYMAQRDMARPYFPAMRFGDYFLAVKPKPGTDTQSLGGFPEVKWFETVERPEGDDLLGKARLSPEDFKPVQDKIAEIRQIKRTDGSLAFPEHEFDIETGDLRRTPGILRQISIPAIDKLFMMMERSVKDDLMTRTLRQEGAPATKEEAREQAGSDYERLHRQLIDTFLDATYRELLAGYKRQAKLTPGYSADMDRAIGAHTFQLSHTSADMVHRDDIERTYLDIQDHHPHEAVRQYWKKWRDYQEDPTSPMGHAAQTAAQIGFTYALALNPSSSFIIAAHTPMAAAPTLSVGVGMGRAASALARALKDSYALARADTTQGFHIAVDRLGKTQDERAFITQMAQEGRLHSLGADDIRALNGKQATLWGGMRGTMGRAMDLAASNISVVDQANRSAVALAAYRMAKDPATLAKMAEPLIRDNAVFRDMVQQQGLTPATMGRFMISEAAFDWGRINRAPFMRGALGTLMTSLHGFQLAYLNTAFKLLKNSGPEGRVAFAWMMGSLAAGAGFAGLPFTQDLGNAGDALYKKITGGKDPMLYFRATHLLEDAGFSKVGAEAVMRGPIASMLGVDLAGRIGFGDVLSRELSGTDILGAVPSLLYGRLNAALTRYQNQQSAGVAATELLPAGIRHPLQAAIESQGGLRTQKGATVVPASKIPPQDVAKIAAGFTPQTFERRYIARDYAYRAPRAKMPVVSNPVVPP